MSRSVGHDFRGREIRRDKVGQRYVGEKLFNEMIRDRRGSRQAVKTALRKGVL